MSGIESLLANHEASNATHRPHRTHTSFSETRDTLPICEKPFALNSAQASAMAATAQKKGVIYVRTFPFTYRYMPSTRYLKHLIDEGYLGQPYHLHMRYVLHDKPIPVTGHEGV